MAASTKAKLRLEADTHTVEDLVSQVRRGIVRVPDFQRPLRWKSEDVVLLFDSIYQGYPIGSFLMRQAHAPASVIRYGPVEITAPESNSALWVVDGQQRLTALTVSLTRSEDPPKMPDDPWVLYFDAKTQEFHTPPKSGVVPSTWIPVTQLLDASSLSEWVFNWEHRNDPSLRKSIFDAGARIRQYEVPLYIVETEEEDLLRDIFYRINDSGKKLKWEEIHDALFGRKLEQPSTLSGLANELQSLRVGRPSEEQLLSAIVAFKGLDVTRSISEHYRKDPDVLRDAVQEALPALRRVLIFLKNDAEIPHLRLLPRTLPFVVLTKFFGLYSDANRRSIDLLVRWTWRILLGIKSSNERTLIRHSLNAIRGADQEKSIQRMLAVAPCKKESDFSLPLRFDARAADSRIALVALSSLQPLDLDNGEPIDIAGLIEQHDLNAFQKIVLQGGEESRSPSNRIFLAPGSESIQNKLIAVLNKHEAGVPVLKSHCVGVLGAIDLSEGEMDKFFSYRTMLLEQTVESFGSRMAAWGMNDRPSISFILKNAGGEA